MQDSGPSHPQLAAELTPTPQHANSGDFTGGLLEAEKTAVRALRSNPFRTVLTLLGIGIVIGVSSVTQALAALPNVLAAVPELGGAVTMHVGSADYQTSATGTTATFPLARGWWLVAGGPVKVSF